MPPLLDQNDVSALCQDPEFCEDVVLRRKVQSVGDDGRLKVTTYDKTIKAVCVPSGNAGLQRTPNAELQSDGVMIYTKETLTVGTNLPDQNDPSGNTGPDEVVWHGLEWIVVNQDDYTAFNFNVVTCVQKSLNGAPVDL
jgi:hypothetical protein